MKRSHLALLVALLTAAWSVTGLGASDANRGARVIEQQGCLACHTVRGSGEGHEASASAPDLAGRLVNKYTPVSLASLIWNHTPEMLAARTEPSPSATAQDWADVFAYLYALQLDEPGASTSRGRRVLEDKNCTSCHALPGGTASRAKPIAAWNAGDPVLLAYEMWSHSPAMSEDILRNRGAWRTLEGRDFRDLLAYAQSVQGAVPNRQFVLPAPAEGEAAFDANCAQCHRGSLSLARRLRNTGWMDLVAGMWNHAPKMLVSTRVMAMVGPDDMARILAYVWELQYQGPAGNPINGQRTFERKGCLGCHSDPATGQAVHPNAGQPVTPFVMVALGWGESRRMHDAIVRSGNRWPNLTEADMRNLIAYVNSLPAR